MKLPIKIHACQLDPVCRSAGGSVPRIHVCAKTWNLGIAYWPSGRFHRMCPRRGERWVWWYLHPVKKGS